MDELAGVCGVEGARDLAGDRDGSGRIERGGQLRSERPLPHVSLRDERATLLLAGRVHRDDVRVLERREHARLADEALSKRRIVGELGRQEPECNPPAESEVVCEVDLARCSAPQPSFESEAEACDLGADERVRGRRQVVSRRVGGGKRDRYHRAHKPRAKRLYP